MVAICWDRPPKERRLLLFAQRLAFAVDKGAERADAVADKVVSLRHDVHVDLRSVRIGVVHFDL